MNGPWLGTGYEILEFESVLVDEDWVGSFSGVNLQVPVALKGQLARGNDGHGVRNHCAVVALSSI